MVVRLKRAIAVGGALAIAFGTFAAGAQADTGSATVADACLTLTAPDATQARIQTDGDQVLSAIRSALGTQYGDVWFCPSVPQFDVAISPGPQDVATATGEVDAILQSTLGSDEAAWFEPYVQVQQVPYSQAQLYAVQTEITDQVEQTPDVNAVGLGISSDVPDGHVVLTIESSASSSAQAQAQAIVDQYPDMAVLVLSSQQQIVAVPLIVTSAPDTAPVQASAPAQVAAAPTTDPIAPALPTLTGLRYRRLARRVSLIVSPGSAALSHVVVTALSRSGRVLARRKVVSLASAATLTLHLSAAPTHVTIELHATSASGASVVLTNAV
jgi:hypothetical protein